LGPAARVSLISGWFPAVVMVLAVATLAVGIVSARARWRRLSAVAAATAAAMAAVAWLVARLHVFAFTYPRSFYAWIGLVAFAAGAAAVGWRPSGWWRRSVSLGAVVVTLMMAATLINRHYAYFPTPAALFGEVAADHMPLSRVLSSSGRHGPWAQTADELHGPITELAVSSTRSHGAVVTVDLPAVKSHFAHRNSLVYLPPAWFARPRPILPVVMLLTGTPSLVSDWTRAAHADQIADEYAAAHHGWAPILVLPDPNGSDLGDTECVDSPQGNAETYLAEDVPAAMVSIFGAAPPHWAVAGLSEGGMCAALLTLRRPDVFSTFADFSGEPGPIVGHDKAATMRLLFGGSKEAWRAHDPWSLLHQRRYDGHAAWFEVGTDDRGPRRAAERLAPAARAAGMTAHVFIRDGRHNFTFWSDSFRHALPWMAARLAGEPDPVLPPGGTTYAAAPWPAEAPAGSPAGPTTD
jgi:S-formylglutathione hydrolase FrmB